MTRNCRILDFYMCRHLQDSNGKGIIWNLKILTYSRLWRDGHIPDMSRNCHIMDFYMCRHLQDSKGKGIQYYGLWRYMKGRAYSRHVKELSYFGLLKVPASSGTLKGRVYYGLWRYWRILDSEGTGIFLTCQGTVIFWTFKGAGIFWTLKGRVNDGLWR